MFKLNKRLCGYLELKISTVPLYGKLLNSSCNFEKLSHPIKKTLNLGDKTNLILTIANMQRPFTWTQSICGFIVLFPYQTADSNVTLLLSKIDNASRCNFPGVSVNFDIQRFHPFANFGQNRTLPPIATKRSSNVKAIHLATKTKSVSGGRKRKKRRPRRSHLRSAVGMATHWKQVLFKPEIH